MGLGDPKAAQEPAASHLLLEPVEHALAPLVRIDLELRRQSNEALRAFKDAESRRKEAQRERKAARKGKGGGDPSPPPEDAGDPPPDLPPRSSSQPQEENDLLDELLVPVLPAAAAGEVVALFDAMVGALHGASGDAYGTHFAPFARDLRRLHHAARAAVAEAAGHEDAVRVGQ